jgi:hypothetical protein
MAGVKYTREQLTSLYSPDCALPADFTVIPNAVLDEPVFPLLCTIRAPLQFHQTGKTRSIHADIPQTTSGASVGRFTTPRKPAPPPPTTAPQLPVLAWFYRDKGGVIRGPYPSERLRSWWDKNMFPDSLEISTSADERSFKRIDQYFPDLSLAFLYNPILFPFLGPVQRVVDDPLEQIFLDFDTQLARQ